MKWRKNKKKLFQHKVTHLVNSNVYLNPIFPKTPPTLIRYGPSLIWKDITCSITSISCLDYVDLLFKERSTKNNKKKIPDMSANGGKRKNMYFVEKKREIYNTFISLMCKWKNSLRINIKFGARWNLNFMRNCKLRILRRVESVY